MCERCEAAKKRLTPVLAQELDELNANMDRMRARIDELRGDPSDNEMQQRFRVTSDRLHEALLQFAKVETERGTFGPGGEHRVALFCPALMLQCCVLALSAGFDIEDTIHMFGNELQAALVTQSGEMVQKLQLMRVPRGNGVMH